MALFLEQLSDAPELALRAYDEVLAMHPQGKFGRVKLLKDHFKPCQCLKSSGDQGTTHVPNQTVQDHVILAKQAGRYDPAINVLDIHVPNGLRSVPVLTVGPTFDETLARFLSVERLS